MISALPDVKRMTITSEDEFMILACDGIWNSLSSEEVVEFVRSRILKGETKMSAICEEVITASNLIYRFRFKHGFQFTAIYGLFGAKHRWRRHGLR